MVYNKINVFPINGIKTVKLYVEVRLLQDERFIANTLEEKSVRLD